MGSDSSDLVRLGRTCTLLPDFDLANIRPFYSYLDAFRGAKDKPSRLRPSVSSCTRDWNGPTNVAAPRAKCRFVNIAGTGYNGRSRFAGRYSKGVVGRGQKRSAKGRRVQHRLRRIIPNVPWGTGLATAALQDRSPGRDNRCKKRDRHTCLPGNKGFCAPSGSSSKLT